MNITLNKVAIEEFKGICEEEFGKRIIPEDFIDFSFCWKIFSLVKTSPIFWLVAK
jgi:hypothetical protein